MHEIKDAIGPADIKALALKCVSRGLGLRDARDLFNALYRADALALANGSMLGAAKITGLTRNTLYRHRTNADRKMKTPASG